MLQNLDERDRGRPSEVSRLPVTPSGWGSRQARADGAAQRSGPPGPDGRAGTYPGAGGTAPRWIPLRQIFWLINEYRGRCAGEVDAHDLASVLSAIIQFARHGFTQAEELRLGGANCAADHARCLADLGKLLNLLMCCEPPPAAELVHAMDDLIVELVNIDDATHRRGAARAPAQPAPG